MLLAPRASMPGIAPRRLAALAVRLGVGAIACARASVSRDVDIRDEPVTFQSGAIRLAGTLFTPPDGRRHAGIVGPITGSS
jgi:hypothetical protein